MPFEHVVALEAQLYVQERLNEQYCGFKKGGEERKTFRLESHCQLHTVWTEVSDWLIQNRMTAGDRCGSGKVIE